MIGTCAASDLPELQRLALETGTEIHVVGSVLAGVGVELRYKGVTGELLVIENERFARNSWFSAGLDAYVSELLHAELTS